MAVPSRKKTDILTISLPQELTRDLKRFAKEQDVPVSRIAKDALKYYMWQQKWNSIQRVFGPAAKKLGIKTDEDVEKFFG